MRRALLPPLALLAAFVLSASVAAVPLEREPAQAATLQVEKVKVKG